MLDGLPLHPLLVHAAVVLIPVTAGAVILAALWPRFRAWLGWGLPVLGVASAVVGLATAHFGEELSHTMQISEQLDNHMAWGTRAELASWVLGIATVLAWLVTSPAVQGRFGDRAAVLGASWLRVTVLSLACILAVAAVVAIFLAGDSGARSVWG